MVSYSGTIRQTLPGHKRTLQSRMSEAETLLRQPIVTEDEDKQAQIEELQVVHQTIARSMQKITELDEQWVGILSAIEDQSDYDTEQQQYNKTALQEPDGYQRVIEQAEAVHIKIQARLDRYAQSGPVVGAPAAGHSGSATRNLHHLPKMTLPTFEGDVLKFNAFWSIFNSAIHRRTDLSKQEKLSYLIPQLRGSAAQAIEGYDLTEDSYDLIVQRLKERFERSDDRFISMLHADLKRIPTCGGKFEEKRKTLDSCERVFRQLEQKGQSLDPGTSLVFDLLAKFPPGLTRELNHHYKVGVYSPLSEVRTTLEKSIMEEELTSGFLRDLQASKQQDNSKANSKPQSDQSSFRQNKYNGMQSHQGSNGSPQTESTLATNTRGFNRGANFGTNNRGYNQGQRSGTLAACYFCGNHHLNRTCELYPTANTRIQRLKQLGRCPRCMRNHTGTCQASIGCWQCRSYGDHQYALCSQSFPDKGNHRQKAGTSQNREFTKQPPSGANKDKQSSADRKQQPGTSTGTLSVSDITNFSNTCTKNSLFQTAKVTAKNLATGEQFPVRICLDTLSNRTYITERAATLLNLKSEGQDKLCVSVFSSSKSIQITSHMVSFGLAQRNGEIMKIDANTTKIISNSVVLPQDWPGHEARVLGSMKNCLADDPFDPDKTVDVLIGADYAWNIIDGPKNNLPECDICLIPSVFGFMLGGQLHYDTPRSNETMLLCITETQCQYPHELGMIASESKHHASYPDIDEFWNLETVGIRDCPVENEDQIAHDNFKRTVYAQDGRYHVKWPWVEEKKAFLPTNYQVALNRFKSLTTRLSSDQQLLQAYRNTIQAQVEAGVIEKVPPEEINTSNSVHYLPHHPVIKTSSATTKIRIVYDASAKQCKQDLSLNECLLRGPVILPNLCQLLIRFRTTTTVVISDVEKAFLQVGVHKEDRDVTRFLWYEDDTNPSTHPDNLAVFRFGRVAFGIISSPFLLGATILHHLDVENTDFAKQLASDIYVDNIISGIPEGDSPEVYYQNLKEIFSRAGMNVQEFCSNSKELMQFIPEHDRMKDCDAKVLGIKWDSLNDDTIRVARSSKWGKSSQLTKRTVLQSIAALFDPLGFFQPATFPAKLFLQKLWLHGTSWDTVLDPDLASEWSELRLSLEILFEIRLPRYVGQVKPSSTIIAFSDASGKGYGAAVYLRSRQDDGTWTTNLIFAKTRLAPVPSNKGCSNTTNPAHTSVRSTVTLPRLELLGVVVAGAAASFCREALQLPIMQIDLFTDSECVLHWLRGDRVLKRFVARRIEKLQEITNCSFHYVSTHDNPADMLTRGKSVEELAQDSTWWHGPSWLSHSSEEWPETRIPPVSTDACQEYTVAKVTPVVHAFATNAQPVPDLGLLGIPFDRFSSLPRMIRVTWMCLKFLKLKVWSKLSVATQDSHPTLRKSFDQISTNSLTSSDYQVALKMCVRHVQATTYPEELTAIRQGTKSTLVHQFNLQLDDDDLLRACSRYQHADLPESTRCPVLLPKNHPFSKLVVLDAHAGIKHAGATHTLSELRRTYWIPHGRAYAKKVIKACVLCRRFKYKQTFRLPQMPPWPLERVSRSAPFQFIGLDYFGPMKVKVNDSVQKMWACLFTCLSTRAVHLEPVMDCTPSEFLSCLKRFMARRGCPQQIISDNAAQFQLVKILADRAWKHAPEDESLLAYSAQQGIRWKFIIALAPWQGGHYERLVGVVKSVLKTIVGRRLLSWTDLITLLAETEAIVNSRPITYVNTELDSGFRVLRPVDFLLYRPITSPPVAATDFPVRDLGEGGKLLAATWKHREKTLTKLWATWYDEYLLSLRERQNIFHRGGRTRIDRIPNEGEVILLREEGIPRGSWKLARVVKLINSADTRVRAAEIQLANGVKLRRTVNFLIPLEIGADITTQTDTDQAASEVVDTASQADPSDTHDSQAVATAEQDTSDPEDEPFYGFSQDDLLRTANLLQHYDDNESQ